MFRPTAPFDKLLDKATSNLLMEPDWNAIIQICDLIRQNDIQPKYALTALKKKLNSPNPHTAYYSLLLLESMVKNCGSSLHEELTSRPFCEALHDLAKTSHENVRNKLLELIQVWSHAFRKNPKHGALKDIMNQMKVEGYKFPVLKESDAMFSTDTAPEWADGDVCHRCRVAFSLIQRKHHCRACGQVFCGQCTQKSTTLPKFGIEKEVRVCDGCYDLVNKPSSASKPGSEKQESELPPEYLNSSLAQQNQAPPRKSEEELREEEELQLALALSQSEAEAKEKEKKKTGSILSVSSYKTPEPRQPEKSPSPTTDDQPDPELARYLNRSYWESLNQHGQHAVTPDARPTSPSAPAPEEPKARENGLADPSLEEFMSTLKSQVEIFMNRLQSNSSRGRSIANDSSVETLFNNITKMHSQLLRCIQEHDDKRLHYERLQDKLTQVRDARAALDALREEHRERLRREAEEAERQRQLQMAHKLEIMRKKKQEYLQYQRQLALQRVQEQEREMQIRQEQQKQQYLLGTGGGQYTGYVGSPVHGGGPYAPGVGYQYGPPGMMVQQGVPQKQMAPGQAPVGMPRGPLPSSGNITGGPLGPGYPSPAMGQTTSASQQPTMVTGQQMSGPPYGALPTVHMKQGPMPMGQQPPPGMQPPGAPVPSHQMQRMPQGHGSQGVVVQQQPQGPGIAGQPNQVLQNQGLPPQGQGLPPQGQGLPPQGQGLPPQGQGIPPSNPVISQQALLQNQQGMVQYQIPGAPPSNPQVQQQQQQPKKEETQVAELISFD